MKKLNRRSVLKTSLGVSGSQMFLNNPLTMLLNSILSGTVNNAHAQESGVNPRNFLWIQQAGGPPSWTLTPLAMSENDRKLMVNNPMVVTRFKSGSRYTDMEYVTVNKNLRGNSLELDMPWLWQFDVAKSGGNTRPMAELMKNMLMIRGITSIEAHAPAVFMRFHPMNIKNTFASHVSDVSSAPIPAVNMEAQNYEHISKKGTSSVDLVSEGQANMLDQLLKAFLANPNRFYGSYGKQLGAVLDSSLKSLEEWSLKQYPASLASSSSLKSAKSMISRGFGDISQEYFGLVKKYQDLMRRTVQTPNLLNINDRPIGVPLNDRTKEYQMSGNDFVCSNEDIRSVITPDTMPGRMAQHFAVTEFILLNQLSSNITIYPSNLRGLNIQTINAKTRRRSQTLRGSGFDEHGTGRFGSLIFNTYYNLCMGACLLELFDQLKKVNLFDDLVVDMSGEMGRRPRDNGRGSDHDKALHATLWSGALNEKPQVIGDIEANSSARLTDPSFTITYNGTWGRGANNPTVGRLTLGNLASTQADLLRIDRPNRSSPSLVKEENGKFVPILPKGKTVT